ncbi:MAG: cyclase family protein, partial [Clostridiales bacterium]|nr:cyclase family protein [Clostridiales bacterium]
SHMGTHIEVPYHHLKEGVDPADYPVENLMGEAIVLDYSFKKNGEMITLDELKKHKDRIKEGDIIFIYTGMDKLFRTERWNEQPYIAEEGIDWLISLKPKIIGTDATGFEVPGTDYQPNHLNMFKNNIAMVESATNLDRIGDERVTVFILPLPIEGIDACPVRIIAVREGGFYNG